MKPIFTYYGGKQRLAERIVKLLPPHKVYAEPFFGGGSVLFAKPFPAVSNLHDYREVVNDIDDNIVNFYSVVKSDPEKLIRILEGTLYSRAVKERAVKILSASGHDPITRAWAYYVSIHQGFSGMPDNSWSVSKKGVNRPRVFQNKVDELREKAERFKYVAVDKVDALRFIRSWDGPDTCFYIDPPYVDRKQGHYRGYTRDDFECLVRLLTDIEGSFLLSGYDDGTKMPRGWKRYRFDAYCSSGQNKGGDKSRKRTEVVWRKVSRAGTEKYPDSIIKTFGG